MAMVSSSPHYTRKEGLRQVALRHDVPSEVKRSGVVCDARPELHLDKEALNVDGNRMILRALKGAPVSVVLALMMARGGLGVRELQGWTGYSDKPVRAALRVLGELGLVQRHAYHSGWLLTARGRQMVLGEGATPENLRSAGSSSGSSLIDGVRVLPETTTTTTVTPENFRSEHAPGFEELGKDWRHVVGRVLCKHCGMGRRRAESVVLECAAAGRFPGQVAYEALIWLAYCQDEERSTINNPAGFIASRVGGCVSPPAGYCPPSGFKLWPKVTAFKRQWNEEIVERHGGVAEF